MRHITLATTALLFFSTLSAQQTGPANLPFTELCVTKQVISLMEFPSTGIRAFTSTPPEIFATKFGCRIIRVRMR